MGWAGLAVLTPEKQKPQSLKALYLVPGCYLQLHTFPNQEATYGLRSGSHSWTTDEKTPKDTALQPGTPAYTRIGCPGS